MSPKYLEESTHRMSNVEIVRLYADPTTVLFINVEVKSGKWMSQILSVIESWNFWKTVQVAADQGTTTNCTWIICTEGFLRDQGTTTTELTHDDTLLWKITGQFIWTFSSSVSKYFQCSWEWPQVKTYSIRELFAKNTCKYCSNICSHQCRDCTKVYWSKRYIFQ